MKNTKRKLIPVLPLRDIVIFPHMIVPIYAGRDQSISALEECIESSDKQIALFLQKDAKIETPEPNDVHRVGVMGTLLQLLRLPDGNVKLLIQADQRIEAIKVVEKDNHLKADVDQYVEVLQIDDELEALMKTCLQEFEKFIMQNKKIPADVLENILRIEDPSKLADTIAAYCSLKIPARQELLEISNVNERLEKVLLYLQSEATIVDVERKIRSRVKQQMEKTQRDYYLNEQLKAINKELHDTNEPRDDISELEEKKKKLDLPLEVATKIDAEIKKLKLMHSTSAEAAIVRNYIDWLVSIPWQQPAAVEKNLIRAENVLNADHYGLKTVKERIMEYLCVQSRLGKVKSQILCLVGPPGVGKTSLAQSIAKATGRTYVRMSLGGVRDESEIRGHRRTYMGSMPGKIIQGMKKAKSSNPLFLLDEIDKMGHDWRGDPASALLEVLDPEQNQSFNDHYIEVDYDLSDVMFITTANSLDMPQPLLDRMEIIRLSGYTEVEKLNIIEKHLLKKQMKLHGLTAKEFKVADGVWLDVIRYYTKEAGVRNLEREIAKLARKAVRQLEVTALKKVVITTENLSDYLSIRKFDYGQIEDEDQVGTTTGLAWTELGGDILSIEVSTCIGKGNVKITGKLGDVMQESAQAALSYIRSRAHTFGIKSSVFEKMDIHIHVPAGAIPKDGPSAGITLCTSLVSALTGVSVRKDVAMTGEITLRGKVLPIGGLKEKMLAAHRAGIKTIIIPFDNAKDLVEIDQDIKENLDIVPVKHMDEVLPLTLTRTLEPVELESEYEGIKRDPHLHLNASSAALHDERGTSPRTLI